MNSVVHRVIMVGSGSSGSTPKVECAVVLDKPCPTCSDALAHPNGPNHRLNPSMVVQMRDTVTGDIRNILFDCTKTFRESAIKVFPRYGIKTIDAVVITHGHADAMLGLDDLREFCGKKGTERSIDCFCNAEAMGRTRSAFPYLHRPPKKGMYTASMTWTEIRPFEEFTACGLRITPFPVLHGKDYICFAYKFALLGAGSPSDACSRAATTACPHPGGCTTGCDGSLLYISDVSDIPRETMAWIKRAAKPPSIVVLDMLSMNHHSTHFSLSESVKATKALGAHWTVYTGIGHSIEHEQGTVAVGAKLRSPPTPPSTPPPQDDTPSDAPSDSRDSGSVAEPPAAIAGESPLRYSLGHDGLLLFDASSSSAVPSSL